MPIDPAESQRRADESFQRASERSREGFSWTPPPPKPPPATEWERLVLQADALDRQAEGYIGCTWTGDRHPSFGLREQAAALRRAAMILKLAAEEAQEKCKHKNCGWRANPEGGHSIVCNDCGAFGLPFIEEYVERAGPQPRD